VEVHSPERAYKLCSRRGPGPKALERNLRLPRTNEVGAPSVTSQGSLGLPPSLAMGSLAMHIGNPGYLLGAKGAPGLGSSKGCLGRRTRPLSAVVKPQSLEGSSGAHLVQAPLSSRAA